MPAVVAWAIVFGAFTIYQCGWVVVPVFILSLIFANWLTRLLVTTYAYFFIKDEHESYIEWRLWRKNPQWDNAPVRKGKKRYDEYGNRIFKYEFFEWEY